MLRSFATDTVFDENAIVAHVLFALLFNEVKYVQTPAELQNIEKAVKGRADVVLAHVQALGTAEHRAVMEAAFVYGAKYQFVLTTGGTVLQHVGVEEPGKLTAGLWFLHCKLVSRRWEPCHHSALKKPLSTVQIYTFLKLMDAPLLTEVSADPADVKTVHNHLQSPVLFLFTQRETLALDRSTAEDHPGVNVPAGHNMAYRLPAEGSRVKYLTLQDIEGVVRLFTEGDRVGLEEEEEQHWSVLDILDDEVSESVYRDRSVNLESHLVPALTAQTFSTAVAAAGHTVVLFYNSCKYKFLQVSQPVGHDTAKRFAGITRLRNLEGNVFCMLWSCHFCSDFHSFTGLPSGASSKGAPRGVQDALYSLDVAGSSPGYSTAD
ncbi:UNVERIFIED_CONTAM: hypothetical protein FKN15_010947 [Acipenser sinensis]